MLGLATLVKLWWCEKGCSGRRDEGERDTISQVTLASLLEGKTQNSEVLMLADEKKANYGIHNGKT